MSKVIETFQKLLVAPKPTGFVGLGALLAIAIDAGRYVTKLEMRYQAKSQRLGEVRRENFKLRAEVKRLEVMAELRRSQIQEANDRAALLEARASELEARASELEALCQAPNGTAPSQQERLEHAL